MLVRLILSEDSVIDFESEIELRDGMKVRLAEESEPIEIAKPEFVIHEGQLKQIVWATIPR